MQRDLNYSLDSILGKSIRKEMLGSSAETWIRGSVVSASLVTGGILFDHLIK